jgi:hypothetical protein
MTPSTPHVSRLTPPGPTVRPPSSVPSDDAGATLQRSIGDDARGLGRLLADVEPLRHDDDALIVTDAHAEVVRFLAVLAVLEGCAPMPDYDLDDPSLKWHAPKEIAAVPNPPTIVSGPASGDAPGAGGAA